MSRCRNCGDPDHATQWCKEYGPWFPEPTRTRESYREEAERISALVAADIIAEHEEGHHAHEAGGVPPA